MGEKEIRGFPGGVHPTDGQDKSLTAGKLVKEYWPGSVTILSEQSLNAKCSLMVKPGDQVLAGQLIGEPQSFAAAPLHASVSGIVREVKKISSQDREILACVIERTGEPEEKSFPHENEAADISEYSEDVIIEGLLTSGLIGMGGAGFPVHKKYETEKRIDTILINGAECELFLTCDCRVMVEQGYGVINGTRLMMKASGADQAYICIEDNKPDAIKNLQKILEEMKSQGYFEKEKPVQVQVLPTKYPQGGERQLIESVLGREVPMGGLPADVGVIVSNVGTAKAAADVVLGKKPLISRIVTVTGNVKEPGNYLVPIGTSAKELIQLCGGVTTPSNRVIAGGPMTGPCAAVNWDGESELFYVTKSTSGILVLPDENYEELPCIRCGSCQRACPVGLVPYQIDFACLEEDYDLCEKLYASECIACGCCSYVCPSRRDLTLRTRTARDMVKQRMRERSVKKG